MTDDRSQRLALLSAAVASRTLPSRHHARALHLIGFLDKIGTTPLPQNLPPQAVKKGDRKQLFAKPSLIPAGIKLAPAVQPFPSK